MNTPKETIHHEELWSEGFVHGIDAGKAAATSIADLIAKQFAIACTAQAQAHYARAFLIGFFKAFRREIKARIAVYQDVAVNAARETNRK
jgi:hypothetical protein